MPLFDLGGIWTNTVSSILWVVIGVLITGLVGYLSRRRNPRVVWKLPRGKRTVSVAVSSLQPEDTGRYSRPATGLGALIATAAVAESLADAFLTDRVRMQIHFSDRFPGNLLSQPLVTIGGPRYNSIAAHQLAEAALRFEFVLDGEAYIRDKRTGARYASSTENGEVTVDYALITRTRNPYSLDTFAINLAGIHTFGVGGAASMLTKPHISVLAKKVRRLGSEWQTLVEVKVVDRMPFPTVIAAEKLAS